LAGPQPARRVARQLQSEMPMRTLFDPPPATAAPAPPSRAGASKPLVAPRHIVSDAGVRRQVGGTTRNGEQQGETRAERVSMGVNSPEDSANGDAQMSEQESTSGERQDWTTGPLQGGGQPRLNPRYTFTTFIVGSGNQLAHAASQAVAEASGQAYNPLFLYGGVGLGKTHLLHAIGHSGIERGLVVLYVSSETFTNDIINAIRYRTTEDFRAKYRSVDVLLVDDIQFIAGKESTEE